MCIFMQQHSAKRCLKELSKSPAWMLTSALSFSRPLPTHKHNMRLCALYLGGKRTDGADCFPAVLKVLAASWKRAVIVPLAHSSPAAADILSS